MRTEYLLLSAGLALAFLMERAVLAWATPGRAIEPATASGLQMPNLAWQTPAWRSLLARATTFAAVAVVLAAALRFDDIEAVRVGVVGLALLACAATDLLAYRVPDAVTIPVLGFALACSVLTGRPEPIQALTAASMAGGMLLVAALLTRGGLGGGDVKLGVLIGASLGLPSAAFALAAGIVLGGVVVIGLYLVGWLGRNQAFPFAPFLAVAAVVFLFAG